VYRNNIKGITRAVPLAHNARAYNITGIILVFLLYVTTKAIIVLKEKNTINRSVLALGQRTVTIIDGDVTNKTDDISATFFLLVI
jgi:hypothetical protein